MDGSTFHALLIGIDFYFPNRLSNGGQYRSLSGCVNDVNRVEAMLALRLAHLAAGGRLRIQKLLGPSAGRGPGGDPASWPTAENIRQALDDLTRRARPGDQVYIHYAGHGGRVATLWQELKGAGAVDEALVPMDIGRGEPGASPRTFAERYIRDVELAHYLDRLASMQEGTLGVVTTLVFDSCYSGGTTRGSEVVPRCATGGIGTLDQPPAGAPAFPGEDRRAMADALQRLRRSAPSGAAAGRTPWLPPSRGYVLLAACRDVELALEASADDTPRAGVLTSAFLEALTALGSEHSWKTVYDRVLARVHARFPSQTPQLVGDIDRQVFGTHLLPIELTLAVTAIDPAARAVTLNGGLATTITNGTQVGIYRPGETDFSVAERRVAIATVSEVSAFTSRAQVEAGADLRRIEIGAPVVLQGLTLRRRVELCRRIDLPEPIATRQDHALDAIRTALATIGHGFLELCPAGQTANYQVAVDPTGRYEICDPRGQPLPYLEPRVSIDDPGAMRTVAAQLRRLDRYHTVLDMTEPSSSLGDQLEIQLLRAPDGWTDDRPVASSGGTPLRHTGDAYSVPTETWVWLRLRNTQPAQPLNVALIDLTRTWEIEMLVPNPADLAGKKYETIAEVPRTFAFKMYTPVPEAIDVFKLFITTGDVDFRLLVTTGVTRDLKRSPAGNPLARLFNSLDAPQNRTRDATPPRSRSSPWTVREMRLRTFR
ncbi:MAG TPA: caspase family protein [Kofleriaceae bacterium]|nr:caspase family protein [Kofleriaceae bacterium]